MNAITGKVKNYFDALLHRPPSSGRQLYELDGIRGFAVLFVIATHTHAFNLHGQGGIGVWLFFVLSGFLLTKIMFSKLPASLSFIELIRYVIRRVFRVLPLYYCVIFFKASVKGKGADWMWKHLVFRLADGHFWSIPQEEVFYLFLPALVAIVFLFKKVLKIDPLITSLLLFAGVHLTHPLFSLNGNSKLLTFKLNIFIFGFVLASLYELDAVREFLESRRLRHFFSVCGVAIIAFFCFSSQFYVEKINSFFGLSLNLSCWEYPVLYAALAMVLIISALKNGSVVQTLFSFIPLRLLGVLSFSIYLLHQQVKAYTINIFHIPRGSLLFIITLIVSTAIGILTEIIIEAPAAKVGKSLSKKLG